MCSKMNKFKTLNLFLSVIDSGSFASAAKSHATDPSTVSKAIKRLEQQLGIALFTRSTRKVVLTPAGKEYAETIRGLYRQLDDCEAQLKWSQETASGHLKINVPVSYGSAFIVPLIKGFKSLYPEISIELTFNDEYVDMIAHSIDLTIRSGRVADSSLIAQKLSPMPFVICGATEVAELAKQAFSAKYLSALPWLQFRFKQTGKLMPLNFEFAGDVFAISPNAESLTILDQGDAMMKLCADGMGLCLMPHFTAKQWVDDGSVDIVHRVDGFDDFAISVIYPTRDYLPKRTRVFIDYLKAELGKIGETHNTTWLDKD